MNIRSREALATVAKLVAAVVVSFTLLILTVNAMRSPVVGSARTYTAEFSDVSGLGVNADVRTRGVRVGKVEAIDLVPDGDTTIARVSFSLLDPYVPTDGTVLSVKYQNLTGVRFIDADFGDRSGIEIEHVPLAQTVPSFDITELFNGLQPVLITLSTDEINRFADNVIAVLQGDGSGLGPMLDDLQRLSEHASDREAAIATLVENMSAIADSMGGRADEVVEFLHASRFLFDNGMQVLDEFPKTATFGPQFLGPVVRLMDAYGMTPDVDVRDQVNSAFDSLSEAVETLRLLPGPLVGLQAVSVPTGPPGAACSNGVLRLPTDVEVLLNGSGVQVCSAG
ncbi:MCE family protein (plasmid) [Rhodococcus rhodochrous]|uniref:MlaD family protein n=1 Tax=Rhodococcus rhodochrous TaxID=1829 RepID=UPI00132F25F8|nr:MlaD family protein [Rhodococcus rhodochrous]QHG85543.1 MCE family protein [Rhodococcus rhodochrous]